MRRTKAWATVCATAMAGAILVGCSKDASKDAPPASQAPDVGAPAASASAPPAASATAAAPAVDCPKGTSGEGTFNKPCDAHGTARMMDVAWTGKTDDQGPHFRVTNKSSSVILYGLIAVYFYDKAGKQIPVKDHPFHSCGGNMFGGVMKGAEKAVLMFSCVPKDSVPDGTATIEAEMPMVGFADGSEKQVSYYWRNNDLSPDARRKGGVK